MTFLNMKRPIRHRERPDIISYDPLGRGSEKSIQKFIHRGSACRNPSRRITVTVGFTGKDVIHIYSKQAGRGFEMNIISGRSPIALSWPQSLGTWERPDIISYDPLGRGLEDLFKIYS